MGAGVGDEEGEGLGEGEWATDYYAATDGIYHVGR